MNNTQFTEQLHKLGYETTTDGGAIIIIGKHDNFDENLKEARSLVKEYGYECSWGVRGGTVSADNVGKKKQVARPTTKSVANSSEDEAMDVDDKAEIVDSENANPEENNTTIDTTGSFEQMSLMDFM